MNRNITLFINDIAENMEKAEEFIGDLTFEDFLVDSKTAYAVVRCLEIIGEASKNIPLSISSKYPEVPWRKMAGIRDKIIHFYFGLNFKIIWDTVKEDIPRLKPLIIKICDELEDKP